MQSASLANVRRSAFVWALAALALAPMPVTARAQQPSQKKPNILIIWGDDIGYWNISANNQGMMGYKTPNIDRIAKEGALFTDWYGQQSCTAGRACFITGQVGFRTGMLKVGLPGAKEGLQARDVTIAELLKAQGYATGQFGKNHLGDLDEHLPTAHGFDTFFGSLYHLNAEDEPEHPDYFKDPELRKRYATRGVIKSTAGGKTESTGPLNKKRMETVDQEVTDAALAWIKEQAQADKPFFCWWNSTRMHIWTRLKAESQGKTGLGIYPDGMVEHDAMVGQLLKALDDLGIADNTIVMYSTDNGAEKFTWPDGGQSPFRGEKNTNWEGGYRVPCAIRWPGVIKPGTIHNDIFAHEDMLPTLCAAAGDPDVKEKLKKGMKVNLGGSERDFKVHLDGYNITDALAGKSPSPRHEFFYFNDDGSLVGLRYNQWKIVFAEQREHGLNVWEEPFVPLRLPKLFNLRSDPFETADHEGMDYERWRVEHLFVMVPAQEYVGKFLATFKEFPPSQKPGSFSIDGALEALQRGTQGGSN